MTYEAVSPRLYLQRLSIEEHLEDFWEQWQDPRLVKWLSVSPRPHSESFHIRQCAHEEIAHTKREPGAKSQNGPLKRREIF
jgi:hypothetical protein